MGRGMWILAALFAAMAIAMMYQESAGGIDRPWAECKENLLTQVFSNACTPRDGMSAPAAGDQQAPLDDGVGKVDRGN